MFQLQLQSLIRNHRKRILSNQIQRNESIDTTHQNIAGHVVQETIGRKIVVAKQTDIKTMLLSKIEWEDRRSSVRLLNDKVERKSKLVAILK